MKKIVFLIFTFLSVSVVYPQNTDYSTTKPQTSPIGLYFEAIIPPFIRQINNNALPFTGGVTYTDFGLGVTFFHDILKTQINYGFMTQDIYESLGGGWKLRWGGNVLGLKLFAGPEINFVKLFGSSWDRISASFNLGFNFSLFEYGDPTWLNSWEVQLEFPKITFPDRNFLRSFSFFIECQLWEFPIDDSAEYSSSSTKNIFFGYYYEGIIPYFVLGVRMYIF